MDDKGAKKVLKISDEFKSILETLEKSYEHIFITGKAGTGKSTLLRLFRKTTKKKLAVLAPTGVAAINVGGQTIHSFFKFPPSLIELSSLKKLKWNRIYKKLDALIIDEISMVRADMMDAIDHFLRINRNQDEPFGGVQIIMFGDMFQIPPVLKQEDAIILKERGYESPYFFDSMVFKEYGSLIMHELTTVYRQDDYRFIQLLDQIREGDIDYEVMEAFNSRVTLKEPPRPYIYLTAYNATAEKINQKRLDELDDVSRLYSGRTEGVFPSAQVSAPQQLVLKEGAQVMILKNDPELQYANGTLGIIKSMSDEKIVVTIKDRGKEKDVSLTVHEWEIKRHEINDKGDIEPKKIGSYHQFPVKLSWAITIHKSQGKTFDRVYVDLGKGAFAPGQTYVALSRCRTFEGVSLRKELTPRDVILDPALIDRLDSLRRG